MKEQEDGFFDPLSNKVPEKLLPASPCPRALIAVLQPVRQPRTTLQDFLRPRERVRASSFPRTA